MKGTQRKPLLWIIILVLVLNGCYANTETEDHIAAENSGTEHLLVFSETENNRNISADEEDDIQLASISEEPETEDQASESVIVVLDPGHDNKECCTNSHPDLGMYEQELNLTIGLACRTRLLEYEGIQVYMTREDGSCPDLEYGGDECIRARTNLTTQVDADLFVSLHCNGTSGVYGAESNGCEVYVSNYSAFTEDCTRLGELVISGLTELGIADGEVRVRTKEEKGYYDDGSMKDWYYLISNNVDAGYPAIIIEHAYMDNPHDNAILQDKANLEAMGTADADAIAAFFGLTLKEDENGKKDSDINE